MSTLIFTDEFKENLPINECSSSFNKNLLFLLHKNKNFY